MAKAIKRKTALEDIRDMIKQQHAENFDGVLRFVRESVQKTRQFVNRSKFAQFPEGEQLYVIETPSFLRHFLPFGGTWAPARFEAKQDGYLFVTPGDCDSDKLKEHNYAALSSLAIREGYPGRYLQTSWATRHSSMLRLIYEEPASAGGWAHFCEERAKEMGHDDTPPSRFMQMQSMILASVRVMIDNKVSTGKMTYQQSIETLIDYLGMDRVCAEAETRRFVGPARRPHAPLVGPREDEGAPEVGEGPHGSAVQRHVLQPDDPPRRRPAAAAPQAGAGVPDRRGAPPPARRAPQEGRQEAPSAGRGREGGQGRQAREARQGGPGGQGEAPAEAETRRPKEAGGQESRPAPKKKSKPAKKAGKKKKR